jgi:hypothetical protein
VARSLATCGAIALRARRELSMPHACRLRRKARLCRCRGLDLLDRRHRLHPEHRSGQPPLLFGGILPTRLQRSSAILVLIVLATPKDPVRLAHQMTPLGSSTCVRWSCGWSLAPQRRRRHLSRRGAGGPARTGGCRAPVGRSTQDRIAPWIGDHRWGALRRPWRSHPKQELSR